MPALNIINLEVFFAWQWFIIEGCDAHWPPLVEVLVQPQPKMTLSYHMDNFRILATQKFYILF